MAVTDEVGVQTAVHTLEQGRLAPIIRGAMLALLIITLTLLYLFVQFRGFSGITAMDQAQIARNVASGKGLTTQLIRPLAIWQLESAGKEIPKEDFPDFYQAPLNPIVNSLPLLLVKSAWKMTPTDLVYAGDRIIAGLSILFFLISVGIWYFVGSRLFDSKLALIGCAIILMTDMMWQFSLSGLPQMLMLLLFSGAMWLTVQAMQKNDRLGTVLLSLFGAGLLFGLMILAHGLATWIFLGWLVFTGVYFTPRGLAALPALAAVLMVTLPWMVRNYSVCGNPFGLSIYNAIASGGSPEEGFLRSMEDAPSVSGAGTFSKMKSGVSGQIESLFSYLGMNLAAGAFFLALLHPFRSSTVSLFRWCIVLMWLGAVAGMGIFGLSGVISVNQLHVLLIPLFVFYGLAFLIVLWNRWELNFPLLRMVFLTVVVILCAVPMLATLISRGGPSIQWPPYVPPFIAVLGDWYGEKEIIASDMPWAVAWYAQRKSVLLPDSVRTFNRLHDYRVLGEPITGLYLTPITGNLRLFADIYKGAYREWALLITRPPRVDGFALPFYTALPIEGECIIFADRDRWTKSAH
ncbi:MAG: glycosyltransferase family 39 protein [Chthoniobacterales bacterium]|nr:glycosyltransferase family 39 protein [Chthoniobacterales bacterium]